MPPEVWLYDRESLERLLWPATEDGDYARRYLVPFLQNGPQTYIHNVQTTPLVLRVGDTILPLTATEYHPNNSYVCSPYNHYVTYGTEELRTLDNPPVEAILRLLYRPIGWYLRRYDFDRVLYVNNWLLSTNLYPALRQEEIKAALAFLVREFPDRAIICRSVDGYRNSALQQTVLGQGARLVFSRQVYYQEVQRAEVQKKGDYQRDLKLLQKTPYRVVEGDDLRGAAQVRRIVELYNDLYLRKYSYHNPQFTEAFISLALEQRLLTIKALEREGRLDAVLGYVARNGVITAPLFGYDTALPQSLGLYRLLTALTSLEALTHQRLVHFSAGVGGFKRLRGALPTIEYNALYDRHLPATRRRPWTLLKAISDRVAVPLAQKYGF
ncbi:MAG: GNAT family N-acetyltransferase [Ardenticatenales bacterium]|nr:GNAT family N-acetyltransferase [Ardenticatenales bacterium]